MLYSPRVNISFFNRIIIYGFIFDCARFLLLRMGFFSSWGEWGLLSSCSARASHCSGFSCCVSRAQGHTGFRSCGTRYTWHVGSSRTRDWTHAPCIGRRILNHWTSREVPNCVSFSKPLTLVMSICSRTWNAHNKFPCGHFEGEIRQCV